MTELFIAFGVIGLVILIMSIGVLVGRKPIKGSCGGVGAALGERDYTCEICGDDPKLCDEQKNSGLNTALTYNATNR